MTFIEFLDKHFIGLAILFVFVLFTLDSMVGSWKNKE